MPTVVRKTVRLHPAQLNFRRSPALYRALAGGRGAGKSYVGAYDLLARSKAGRLYVCIAPTYPVLEDASWRTLLGLAKDLGYYADDNRGDLRLYLTNGAEVVGRSADNPERRRGPNLSGAWLDEASQMSEDVFSVTIGSLREQGEAGWLSATYTPRGRQHWTYRRFANGGPDVAHFHAPTRANPFLPSQFEATLRRQYTTQFAAQEVEGLYVEGGGTMVRREWFRLVRELPAEVVARVRYWDTAGTDGAENPAACFTAGVLMARYPDGRYGVEDVVRGQWSAGTRDRVIADTADLDRLRYGSLATWREQGPGDAGKDVAAAFVRMLSGHDAHADRVTGNKVERYQPFAAQVEAGNVLVKVADWTDDYLDEQASFPDGAWKDQADASSGAFNKLAGGGDWSKGIGTPGEKHRPPAPPADAFRAAGKGGGNVLRNLLGSGAFRG